MNRLKLLHAVGLLVGLGSGVSISSTDRKEVVLAKVALAILGMVLLVWASVREEKSRSGIESPNPKNPG